MFNDYYTDEMRLGRGNATTYGIATLGIVASLIVLAFYLGRVSALLVDFMNIYAELSV